VDDRFGANEIAVTKGQQRFRTLFLLGGNELRRVHKTLPVEVGVASTGTTFTEYDKAVIRLTKHFNPQRNTIVERFTFRAARQNSDETIAQWVSRLRTLAQYCEFAKVDEEIVIQVVEKCNSSVLRQKFLAKPKLDIVKLLEMGGIHDTVGSYVETIEQSKAGSHSLTARRLRTM
jgi:hypothetical protein